MRNKRVCGVVREKRGKREERRRKRKIEMVERRYKNKRGGRGKGGIDKRKDKHTYKSLGNYVGYKIYKKHPVKQL